MMQRFVAKAVANTLIFTLTYCPLLGTLTGNSVAAQPLQNTTTSYGYDALGNLIQVIDPLGHASDLSYDARNRLTAKLLAPSSAGGVRPAVKYVYDGLDQLTTVTDPRGIVTSYTNDGLGNPTALASPDTGTSGKTYDAAGNVVTSTDARGKVSTYAYDALDRVISINYAAGTPVKFEYDGGATPVANAIGRLSKMTDNSGSTSFAYDQHGRLIKSSQLINRSGGVLSRVTCYAYGNAGSEMGKLVNMTYPSGNRINYSYDAAGQVSGLTLNAADSSGATGTAVSVLMSEISYAAFGAAQSWRWGNDTTSGPNLYNRGFDLDGRLVSYPLGNAAQNGLIRTISYDAASRITAMTHVFATTAGPASALDQSYVYDDLHRLTNVVTATGTLGYAYDANGNRTQSRYGGSSYNYTVDANSNRLTATTGPTPALHNSFDASGNVIANLTRAYSYGDDGRMLSMWKSSTENAGYYYNGFGQRVRKTSPLIASGGNMYTYDAAGHLLGEYETNGAALEETVYLGDLPVAVLMPQAAGPTLAYYIYADQINTPRVITSAENNAMVWRWDSADPFGVTMPNESPTGARAFVYNPRFPGQLYDRETNTYYNYYRDYDPQTGRYLQSDPIGLNGGINTYGYVGGNPLSLIDPFGLVDRAPDFSITGADNPVRQIWDTASQKLSDALRGPDYVSASANIYIWSGGAAMNLHNGNIYYQGSFVRAYPGYSEKPGVCLLAGNIVDSNVNGAMTDNYMTGGGLQATYIVPITPLFGVGGGMSHAYGGAYAIEYGVGTPGVSVSPATIGVPKGK